MDCIHIALSIHRALKALYILMPQTSTHSHTDVGGYYLRCQPAHREWLGVQCLARSRTLCPFVRRSRDRTSNRTIGKGLLYLLNHYRPSVVIFLVNITV